MSRRSLGEGDLDFLQGFLKRGFVNIPRMLFDYSADLGLDYDTIGRIFAVMAFTGGPGESAFESYTISRRSFSGDYDQIRTLISDLQSKDIILAEHEDEQSTTFSFIPLYFRLRANWNEYREQHEREQAANGPHPAISAAERVLGRPLSDRDVKDIQDWIATYEYDVDMVIAVCKEGMNQGVTRMTYLNQVALQWHEEGIRTPEEAEAYAQRHRKASGKHKVIVQYLGLKRQLTGAEQALLDKWTTDWGFSNEVIMRACDLATGAKNPLQYVNRVLESWRDQGVKTVADVDQIQSEHKRRTGGQPPADPAASRSRRSTPPPKNSTVFLQREKKDEKYYEHVYKPFGE